MATKLSPDEIQIIVERLRNAGIINAVEAEGRAVEELSYPIEADKTKTYIFHFEGAIDIKARNEDEAWQKLEESGNAKSFSDILLNNSQWKLEEVRE